MMVVMLILSVVLAAFAPVMTTRSKTERTSPWRYSSDNTNIYYGLGDNQTAMIGQPNKDNGNDPSSRLIINTSDKNQKHIVFKRGDNNLLGSLYMTSDSIIFGSSPKIGQKSVSIGKGALHNNSKGNSNTAIGYNSLNANTTGSNNVAVGDNALKKYTGSDNTAIGSSSLADNINGEKNTAVGYISLSSNTEGFLNTAIGASALSKNTSGNSNIALGGETLKYNTTGKSNTAVGTGAMMVNTTGYDNTAVGMDSLSENTTGYYNTSLGVSSLSSNKEGNSNTAVGYGALLSNNNGERNTAIGYKAMAASSGGGDNIAIGNNAMLNNTGYYNIGIGRDSISNNTRGEHNVAIGISSLYSLKSGILNVAIGSGSAKDSISGIHNVAIGGEYRPSSGASSSGGVSSFTLGENQTGVNNVAIGAGALAHAKGNWNVAIGTLACQHVTGSNKVCIGANSGPDVNDPQANNSNEAVYIGTPGSTVYIPGDLIVGKSAVIGARSMNDSRNYRLYLKAGNKGHDSDWVYLGTDDYKGGDDNFYREGSFTVGHYSFSRWAGFPSDRRLKYVGTEFTTGLDKIKQLKVFNYTFKEDKNKTPHVGVIAQDLQKVFPNAVVKNKEGFLTVRIEDMFFAVINAIKELDAKVTQLIKKDTDKDAKIKVLEAKNAELEARLLKLEKQLN